MLPNPHWNLTLKCQQQQHNGSSQPPVWPLWAPEAAAMPGPDSLPTPKTPFSTSGQLIWTFHSRVSLIRLTLRQAWQTALRDSFPKKKKKVARSHARQSNFGFAGHLSYIGALFQFCCASDDVSSPRGCCSHLLKCPRACKFSWFRAF